MIKAGGYQCYKRTGEGEGKENVERQSYPARYGYSLSTISYFLLRRLARSVKFLHCKGVNIFSCLLDIALPWCVKIFFCAPPATAFLKLPTTT